MGSWKQDLFGCFSNINLCLYTYCCPCFVTGAIGEKTDLEDGCFMGGCKIFIPLYNIWYLKKQREAVQDKEGIEQLAAWKEWAIVCCLGLCSVTQQANQMNVGAWKFEMMGEDIERN